MATSRRRFIVNSAVLGMAGYAMQFTPSDIPSKDIKVPDWARGGPTGKPKP